jgi:hypothetical protein
MLMNFSILIRKERQRAAAESIKDALTNIEAKTYDF